MQSVFPPPLNAIQWVPENWFPFTEQNSLKKGSCDSVDDRDENKKREMGCELSLLCIDCWFACLHQRLKSTTCYFVVFFYSKSKPRQICLQRVLVGFRRFSHHKIL
jgi:hypothetical protein